VCACERGAYVGGFEAVVALGALLALVAGTKWDIDGVAARQVTHDDASLYLSCLPVPSVMRDQRHTHHQPGSTYH